MIGDYSDDIQLKSCGLSEPMDSTSPAETLASSRIIGGQKARSGEFPWMASIHIAKPSGDETIDQYCGGAIISPYWVLTVASCLTDIPIKWLSVWIGSTNKIQGQRHRVANITAPNGLKVSNGVDNIALIRLRTKVDPIVFDKGNGSRYYTANSVCLPVRNSTNTGQEMALFSGWGSVADTAAIAPLQQSNQNDLHKTDYVIDGTVSCGGDPKQVCGREFRHMACFGDGGSPLVQYDNNRAVLLGIYSHHRLLGSAGTGQLCPPAVQYFTRVSYYIDWILRTVGDDNRRLAEQSTVLMSEKSTINPYLLIIIAAIIASVSLAIVYYAMKNINITHIKQTLNMTGNTMNVSDGHHYHRQHTMDCRSIDLQMESMKLLFILTMIILCFLFAILYVLQHKYYAFAMKQTVKRLTKCYESQRTGLNSTTTSTTSANNFLPTYFRRPVNCPPPCYETRLGPQLKDYKLDLSVEKLMKSKDNVNNNGSKIKKNKLEFICIYNMDITLDHIMITSDITLDESSFLYGPQLLKTLDYSSAVTSPSQVGKHLVLRPLHCEDYKKGYTDLLSHLMTNVGPISEHQFKERFVEMKNDGKYYVTVIEDVTTGRIVSSATLYMEYKFVHNISMRGRIEDVVVDSGYRGQRLGQLAIETLKLMARELGCYKVTLDCRDHLSEWYRTLGFTAPVPSHSVTIRFFD
ncbi:unnamed protein product [Medioppia subpectinata]|uniref:glucosamine-phosphate N-acetyltransferase n=1 Tax=Medioppia subpectinata TaxID=1979941 RepID=A0A7R9PUL3_9ACAR|nr:unnamed protein product [Medioppia subpectinata]CAG2101657.1 unnamed protein product [Medioppia subpectinata]